MLNRRVLRIKVMQSLFSYYQMKEADYLLGEDEIRQSLQPNLNLDIPEDKKEMAEKEKIAVAMWEKYRAERAFHFEPTGDERVDVAVKKAVNRYLLSVEKDKTQVKSRMLLEADDLYKNFLRLLQLLMILAKRNEGTTIASNKVLAMLEQNQKLQQLLLKYAISWNGEEDLLKTLNREVLRKNEAFIAYQSLKETTLEQDQDILKAILKEVIFGSELMSEYLEGHDLYWEENKSILRSMLKKSIKDAESGELLSISQNWDDDRAFFQLLYDATMKEDEWLDDLIAAHAKNWEKDRLALTDVIILKMGVSEMIQFPSVPVKVSINEYIEISKAYSTPKSKQFINGMLDKLAEELQKQGKITKSGRGLIDNK